MARVLSKAWYHAFLECASPHTEAPDKFLMWSAFSVIGAVAKARVFVKDGLFILYPNQFIVLVSPPGIGKGTAINFAWGVVKETGPNFIANMVSDRITAPKIIDKIAEGWNIAPSLTPTGGMIIGQKDHTCTIHSTELETLITSSDWMLPFMCEAWERRDYEYQTKNSGSSFIKDMCTSLIAATVPEFVQRIDISSGGFSSRCIFIYDDKASKDLPFPPPINKNHPLYVGLQNDLKHIATLGGEFTITPSARIKYERFSRRVKSSIDSDTEAVVRFKARIRAHTFKLCMIISLARKDALVIDDFEMDNAIAIMEKAIDDLEKVFRGSGQSPDAESAARVQSYIEAHGMANKKELIKHLHRHMTMETLERILFVLETMGWLIPQAQGKTTYYKKI